MCVYPHKVHYILPCLNKDNILITIKTLLDDSGQLFYISCGLQCGTIFLPPHPRLNSMCKAYLAFLPKILPDICVVLISVMSFSLMTSHLLLLSESLFLRYPMAFFHSPVVNLNGFKNYQEISENQAVEL